MNGQWKNEKNCLPEAMASNPEGIILNEDTLGSSKPAEQNQDQHDNEYEAEPAATVIAGPIERAAPESAKAAK